MTARGAARLWELDLARTAAIGMMVAYHVGYDIGMLAPQLGLDPFRGGWRALQIATGSSFLVMVGVSLAVSSGRGRARGLAPGARYRRHARRAAVVLAAALLVTAATRLALGDAYVRFGILHLIGVSMLLAPVFLPLRAWNLALAAAVVAAGLAVRDTVVDAPGALALGFATTGARGVDVYPLLPWFGAVLAGLAIGAWLYPEGGRRPGLAARLPDAPRGARALGAPGRHALPIYLVHQPVLIPLVAGALLAAGVEIDTSGFG